MSQIILPKPQIQCWGCNMAHSNTPTIWLLIMPFIFGVWVLLCWVKLHHNMQTFHGKPVGQISQEHTIQKSNLFKIQFNTSIHPASLRAQDVTDISSIRRTFCPNRYHQQGIYCPVDVFKKKRFYWRTLCNKSLFSFIPLCCVLSYMSNLRWRYLKISLFACGLPWKGIHSISRVRDEIIEVRSDLD